MYSPNSKKKKFKCTVDKVISKSDNIVGKNAILINKNNIIKIVESLNKKKVLTFEKQEKKRERKRRKKKV